MEEGGGACELELSCVLEEQTIKTLSGDSYKPCLLYQQNPESL